MISLNPQKRADESRASPAEQDNVQAVLHEADHPSYWVSASKDGNRESHYRGDNIVLSCVEVQSSATCNYPYASNFVCVTLAYIRMHCLSFSNVPTHSFWFCDCVGEHTIAHEVVCAAMLASGLAAVHLRCFPSATMFAY